MKHRIATLIIPIATFLVVVISLADQLTCGAEHARIGDLDIREASLHPGHCGVPSDCTCGRAICSCEELDAAPLWTVSADALFLDRRDPAAVVLAVNTANQAQNLNAADFNFNHHAGFDLALTRQLCCDYALEFRYFAVEQWDAGAAATTTPNNLLQINAAVPIFTFTGDAITANYRSQLHNAEIHGRHQFNDWLDLLAGFRYVELDERGTANLVNSAVPFNYNSATRNRLYGFQLGGQARLWNNGKDFCFDAVGKVGIFANQAAQDSAYSTGLVTLPATGSGDPTAFVGEIGLTGASQLTSRLAIRFGYRLLWIDGVALASDQLSVSDFANDAGFNGSGDVFYHGAFVGLDYQW